MLFSFFFVTFAALIQIFYILFSPIFISMQQRFFVVVLKSLSLRILDVHCYSWSSIPKFHPTNTKSSIRHWTCVISHDIESFIIVHTIDQSKLNSTFYISRHPLYLKILHFYMTSLMRVHKHDLIRIRRNGQTLVTFWPFYQMHSNCFIFPLDGLRAGAEKKPQR